MIRQCAILFGCLALGELIAAHPVSEIGLDQVALGARYVRLLSC